jgi:hypothetical protein
MMKRTITMRHEHKWGFLSGLNWNGGGKKKGY